MFYTTAYINLKPSCDPLQQVLGNPSDLMSWLDRIFVAFDGLVDAYGERVNKIEVVSWGLVYKGVAHSIF